jgi:predicted metallo-beta-lactamase superfamily hydrolase
MDNWKIGDKCFYIYGNNPKEGRIKNITFFGENGEDGKIKLYKYKVIVNYSFNHYAPSADQVGYSVDTDEPDEIFPTKEALMIHLDNLIEESIHNYKRYEEKWKKY